MDPTTTPAALMSNPHITVLAATDLVSGSRALYSIGVAVLVIVILLGGRIGSTIAWALVSVIVAVIIGSGYAIYVSTKRTVDQTGITTGQYGR